MKKEETTATESAEKPVIDPDADLETREAQARDYLFSITDDAPPAEPDALDAATAKADEDDSGDDASTDDADGQKPERKGSLSAQARKLRQLERKLQRRAKELEEREKSLSIDDPLKFLTARGYDKSEIIDKLLWGEGGAAELDATGANIGKNDPKVDAALKELAELRAQIQNEKMQKQRGDALKEISSKLSEETHFWLLKEDDPSGIVLGFLEEEFAEDPNSDMTVEEAAEFAESYFSAKAERVRKALGDEVDKVGKSSAPPKSPRSAGGSAPQKSWAELSVEEREAMAIRELRESLRERA